MLASTDTLRATIIGKGGHAAMPHDAIDPVPVAAEIILALQTEVARRTPVTTDPIVLSITSVHAGTTHNVLPGAVDLLGTLRTLVARRRASVAAPPSSGSAPMSRSPTAAPPTSTIEPGYPATINDPRAVALIRQLAGDAYVEAPAPSMGGEDFSYVLRTSPGRDGVPRRRARRTAIRWPARRSTTRR